MSSPAKVFFGVGLSVAIATLAVAAYLMARIHSLDAEALAAGPYEAYELATRSAEAHRAFFRQWLWMFAAASLAISLWGWVEYGQTNATERSGLLLMVGIVATCLSGLLMLALGVMFVMAGGH